MLKQYLETMISVLTEGSDDSDLLNSEDHYIIILYRIFRFIHMYIEDTSSETHLKIKNLTIHTMQIERADFKVIITEKFKRDTHCYLIMKKKIILTEYKYIIPNLEKIYNIIKENY